MTVAAETPEPVIGFIAKLEGFEWFGAISSSGIHATNVERPDLSASPLGRLHAQKLYISLPSVALPREPQVLVRAAMVRCSSRPLLPRHSPST